MNAQEAAARGRRDRERGLGVEANPYNVAKCQPEWQAWREGWTRANDVSSRLATLFYGWSK